MLTLLDEPEGHRDPGQSDIAREAMLAAITGEAPPPEGSGPTGAAVTLRASLDWLPGLSAGERHLLGELLDRLAESG